jgi:hypothetical protein
MVDGLLQGSDYFHSQAPKFPSFITASLGPGSKSVPFSAPSGSSGASMPRLQPPGGENGTCKRHHTTKFPLSVCHALTVPGPGVLASAT